MKKKVPLKATSKETSLSWVYVLICFILWPLLLVGITHLLLYYWFIINKEGFYSQESIKICIYIIIGTFAFLFIYKDKVREIFKIKRK